MAAAKEAEESAVISRSWRAAALRKAVYRALARAVQGEGVTEKQFASIVCKKKVQAFAYVEVQSRSQGNGTVQYELFFKEGISKDAYSALLTNVYEMLHKLEEACGESLDLIKKRSRKDKSKGAEKGMRAKTRMLNGDE